MRPRIAARVGILLTCALACTCTLPSLPLLAPAPTASKPPAAAAGTPLPPAPIAIDAAPFDVDWADRSLFARNLTSPHQTHLAGLPGASVYHIALSLSDPPSQVSGVEHVRYTNQEDVSLVELDFAIFAEILGGSITVRNVELDGQPATTGHTTGILTVALPKPLEPGESVVVRMDFEVHVPAQGGGYYYGIFAFNGGILSLAHACPTVLVYNEDGWDDQLPDLDGDPLASDASFYLVSVDAPAGLVLVGSGTEVQRTETAGRQRVLYADGPARDFYLAAAAGLVQRSQRLGEVTINSYAFPQDESASQQALELAAAALAVYDRRYGPYPYTEFDLLPIVTEAGGVEFPGVTAVAANILGGPLGDWLEIVIAHELAHQWFYNLVGNQTQAQPYLDESLVAFATWEYFSDRRGQAGQQTYLDELQSTWYSEEEVPIGLAVSDYTSNQYVQIIYGRGAFFFAALRDRMGRAVFDRFMKDYVEHFAWDIATTDTFKALAEQECGCDLTPLFEEWVYPK